MNGNFLAGRHLLLLRATPALLPVASHALSVLSPTAWGWRALGTLQSLSGGAAAAQTKVPAQAPTPLLPQPSHAAGALRVPGSSSPGGQQPSSTTPNPVLGVLSSLLADVSQQQQPNRADATAPQQASTAAAVAAAAAQMQADAAFCGSSASMHPQACQPDTTAASSGVVRMESQILFDACWRRFKEKHKMEFAAPREIVWLNGAPGSGKGVSTPHILRVRGMTRAVCMSSLLGSAPEAQPFITAGEMISDATVGDLLLEALLQPAAAGYSTADLNVVVDGFPRTAVQVDFVKLLGDKLDQLHLKFVDTPFGSRFPRPAFKVVVLYVDEATSIHRQLQRAVAARAHNIRVRDAGVGEQGRLHEERPTDLDLNKATKRYQIFRQHYSAILRLKQFLPFHLIDAMGSLQDTQEQITQELRYQSSLDLSEDVYSAIRHLPLAKDLSQTARQQLVSRLEGYCSQQRPLFGRMLGLLQAQVLPLLQQGALAGAAEWVSQEELLAQPGAVDMLLDVLADRGFKATYCRETATVPVSFDTATGAIATRAVPQHRFRFAFELPGERDAAMLKALEIAARITEAGRTSMAVAAAANGAGLAHPQQQQQQQGSQTHGQHLAAAQHHQQHQQQPRHPFQALAGAAQHQQQHLGPAHVGMAGMVGLQPAAPITESFIPEHLDHEAKARRAQELRRVALASTGSIKRQGSAPSKAASSSRSSSRACAGGCGTQPGSGAAASCTGASGDDDDDDEEVHVIQRCLRPDLNCGHSQELEVVSVGN